MHRQFNRLRPALFGLFLCVFFASCVTTEQVRDIVSDSNQAMLGQIVGSEVSELGETGRDWESVSRDILSFIAEHPDQTVTNNALRVRLAMLYLQNGKLALAESAFGEVETGGGGLTQALPRSRDRALYESREALLFMFAYAGAEDGLPAAERGRATNALTIFHNQIIALAGAGSIGIQDYFREAQALLALKYFRDIPFQESEDPNSYDLLSRAFEDLAGGLTDQERRLTRVLAEDGEMTLDRAKQEMGWTGDPPQLATLRRILRAGTALQSLLRAEDEQFSDLGLDSLAAEYFGR